MMRIKRKPLTPDMARHWAELAHVFFIDALSTATPMSVEQIAFHGGTNLHLSWGSPRHSEDLDFLVSRDFGGRITELMPKIEKRMRSLAAREDPDLRVDISDRTRDANGLLNFRVVLSSRMVVGQVMAKAEFWQVESDYLKNYETRFMRPVAHGDIFSRISQPAPAATLQAAFADKVVALGYRPHLKWRDLFDLWWISGQTKISMDQAMRDIRHHASAYQGPEGRDLAQGLRAFLALDPAAVAAQANPDLKRWLPKALWDTLYPIGIGEIVEHARETAGQILQGLEATVAGPAGGSGRDHSRSECLEDPGGEAPAGEVSDETHLCL